MTPRERLSSLAQCLRSLKAAADCDTEFIVINQGYTRADLARAARVVAPAELRVIGDGSFLSEGAARNLGLEAARAPTWVLLVDGEVTVAADVIEKLRRGADQSGAAVVVPLILERPGVIHSSGGELVIPDSPSGEITYRGDYMDQDCSRAFALDRTELGMVETHIMLIDKSLLGTAPFAQDHIHLFHFDFSLTCQKNGWLMVREPSALALFNQPPPLSWRDYEFYSQRWNKTRFEEDSARFVEKWGYTCRGRELEAFEQFALRMSIFPGRLRNRLTQPLSNAVVAGRKGAGGLLRARRLRHEGGRLTLTPSGGSAR